MSRIAQALACIAAALALGGCSSLSKPEVLEAIAEPLHQKEQPAQVRPGAAVGEAGLPERGPRPPERPQATAGGG